MLTSARRGISYPNPDRSDRPDIPLHIGNLIPFIDASVIFNQGTNAARLAAAHQASGGRYWWETDNHLMYYDDGATWWPISPTTLTGLYSAQPVANTVPNGTRYFATDTLGTWLSNGASWTLVTQGRPRISVATFLAAPFSTIPYDNQEVLVIVDATNGVNFAFKYNAGSVDSHKWEAIGAPELSGLVATDEVNGSAVANTFGDLTTNCQVTVPLEGDYDIGIFALTYGSTGGVNNISPKIGAAATSNIDGVGQAGGQTTSGLAIGLARDGNRKTSLPRNTVLKMQYVSSNNPTLAHFLQRRISIRPVRVSTA